MDTLFVIEALQVTKRKNKKNKKEGNRTVKHSLGMSIE